MVAGSSGHTHVAGSVQVGPDRSAVWSKTPSMGLNLRLKAHHVTARCKDISQKGSCSPMTFIGESETAKARHIVHASSASKSYLSEVTRDGKPATFATIVLKQTTRVGAPAPSKLGSVLGWIDTDDCGRSQGNTSKSKANRSRPGSAATSSAIADRAPKIATPYQRTKVLPRRPATAMGALQSCGLKATEASKIKPAKRAAHKKNMKKAPNLVSMRQLMHSMGVQPGDTSESALCASRFCRKSQSSDSTIAPAGAPKCVYSTHCSMVKPVARQFSKKPLLEHTHDQLAVGYCTKAYGSCVCSDCVPKVGPPKKATAAELRTFFL